jgi:O-antigen ligase
VPYSCYSSGSGKVRSLTLDRLARFLWGALLVALPVTSFRYMPLMGAGTYVRPLALYPLGLLMLVLLGMLWMKQIPRPWPGTFSLLLVFVLIVGFSIAWGALFAPVVLRGVSYWDRALRASITVVIGLSFFVAAVWMNQDEDALRFSVKWLLAGMALHLLWGSIQAVGLNIGLRPYLNPIQQSFSVRGLVKNKRISGFAYEPSWLAGQLATIYLPWLFASLLARYRISRFRWLTYGLLLGGLTALLLTYSRSGLFITVGALSLTLLLAGGEPLSAFWGWYRAGFRRNAKINRWNALQNVGSRIVLGLGAVGTLAAAAYLLADKGYIATFWNSAKGDLWSYAVDVYLGPRLAYAVAALNAFQQHPWTGVGLGASGFYIYHHMPDWILYGVPEIARQLSPDSGLYPNPKNMYIRLLAEAGLPGLIAYLTFLLSLFGYALSALRKATPQARFLGMVGIFSLAAVALQGISQDSFALPDIWINLGILAGLAGRWLESDNSTVESAGSLDEETL